MAKVCQITGKKAITGNNVSHSNHRTKRKFNPNLHKRRFYIPETGEWITLQVSAKGIRIINRRGISAVIKEARKNGNALV
ncbi:MAG TPA: 50S ribosomal protein L28 [Bacteroidales bacterium]|nr:50S ribosomal protein L28 [Bacteroidales bacterium]